MNKKLIIITAGLGLVCFGGMFAVAWFTAPAPEVVVDEAGLAEQGGQVAQVTQLDNMGLPMLQATVAGNAGLLSGETKKTMTARQLKSLVFEVREKIDEYDEKLNSFATREQRLKTAHEMLKADIEELNNLRIELASTVAGLKSEHDKLLKSRVEIGKIEQRNLLSIAAAYDKMAPESAGQILTSMKGGQSSISDDAVKILYYMSDRTKAKVLASIAEAEPAISAYLCQKLKHMIEE